MSADEILKDLIDAAHHSNWRLVTVLGLVGLVAGARALSGLLSGKLGDFLRSDRGGALLALVGGVAGAVSSAALAGHAICGQMILDGIVMGFTAAGGFSVVKKILGLDGVAAAARAAKKAAAPVLSLMLVGMLTMQGCAWFGKTGDAILACARAEAKEKAPGLLPLVADIVENGKDWQSDLKALALQLGAYGMDIVNCAVAQLLSPAPAMPRAGVGLSPAGRDHAAQWLAGPGAGR